MQLDGILFTVCLKQFLINVPDHFMENMRVQISSTWRVFGFQYSNPWIILRLKQQLPASNVSSTGSAFVRCAKGVGSSVARGSPYIFSFNSNYCYHYLHRKIFDPNTILILVLNKTSLKNLNLLMDRLSHMGV